MKLEELRQKYKGEGQRTINLNSEELREILAIALDLDLVSFEVETSHDYRDCYYEGDTPDIIVDGFVLRKRL